MKQKIMLFSLVMTVATLSFAQKKDENSKENAKKDSTLSKMLTVLQNLKYQDSGTIPFTGANASLVIPKGFKYVDSKQSKAILEDVWGNPPSDEPLGMLFPENGSPLDSVNGWAFVITYEDMGYVKDADADEIKYDEMLKDMKQETEDANAERTKLGYEAVHLVGWASTPFYDKERKTLHWAKALSFGDSPENTLNYDIRILGRKGLISMNAVGGVSQLPMIKPHINNMIAGVQFSSGNRYADYDSNIDKVAAVGIGGLIAGKVLAKIGFFAVILKFWKLIVGAIAIGGAGIKKFFSSKSENA